MKKRTLGLSLLISAFAAAFTLGAQTDRRIIGEWRGTRSERNPITGQNFTVDFTFAFRSDGIYEQEARFGRLTIFRIQGRYALQMGSRPGYPGVTHVLALTPGPPQAEPAREELRLVQIADLPNVERTEQYVSFYDLAPAGAMTLQDRQGGESWGLQKVR